MIYRRQEFQGQSGTGLNESIEGLRRQLQYHRVLAQGTGRAADAAVEQTHFTKYSARAKYGKAARAATVSNRDLDGPPRDQKTRTTRYVL